MDVVYPFKKSKNFDKELRYSLRSLSNLSCVDRVFLVGDPPPRILQNVIWIPFHQGSTKSANVRHIYKIACMNDDISDDFIWMNDDMYIMRPMDEVKLYHRGPLADFLHVFQQKYPKSYYTKMIEKTTGYSSELLCYELHMPMVLNKKKALEILNNKDLDGMMFRTLYGNIVENGAGELSKDVKWYRNEMVKWYKNTPSGFLSSDDGAYRGEFEEFIKKQLQERGKYERF